MADLESENNSRIRLHTDGAETIYRWVKLADRNSKEGMGTGGYPPMGHQTMTLHLISHEMGMVVDGFQLDINYDPRQLKYYFDCMVGFPVEPASSVRSMLEIRGFHSSIEPKPTVDLDALEISLSESLGEGYLIQRGHKDGLTIVENDSKDSFLFHNFGLSGDVNSGIVAQIMGMGSPMMGGFIPPSATPEIYQLRSDSKPLGGFEEFLGDFQRFNFVTERLLTSLHQIKDEEVPVIDEKFDRDIKTQLDETEKALNGRRRMMEVTGMIDGSEELSDEIRQKVILKEKPTTTFEDIGGCEDAKRELLTVVDVLRNPDIYRKWGTYAPKGVLLEGLPGTGKTLLARALANRADASFFHVKIADILHSLYGRTERLIQGVFDEAEKSAPVVVFFDEIDAITAHREQSSEVTSRIVTVLLTNMDGLEERNNGVVVVGATNRLSAIDSALLRPGRFDLIVNVPLPERAERSQIFEIHMNRAVERSGGRALFGEGFLDGIDIVKLVSKTDKFSGADIAEVVRRTLTQKVRQESAGENPGPVTEAELLETVQRYEKVRIAKQKAVMGLNIPR